MLESLQSLNLSLFFLVNNGLHSDLNDLWIGNATYLGIGWIAYVMAIFGILILDRPHIKRNLILFVVAAISEGILLQLIKSLVETPRPLSYFAEQIRIGSVTVHTMFDPLYARSFPSGHAQTAFCAAAVLAWVAIRSDRSLLIKICIPILAYSLAVLVAISRIYVGAHFPIDVLGGAILGVVPVWWIGNVVSKITTRTNNSSKKSTESPGTRHPEPDCD
jgi:undecaprenyl-diphosphatase